MRKVWILAAIMLSAFMTCGCHKPEPASSDNIASSPVVTEDGSNDHAPNAAVVANDKESDIVEAKINNTDPNDSTAHQNDEINKPDTTADAIKIDFKSKNCPEIRTTSTSTAMAWGIKERTSLQWHRDLEIYYEIPQFKGDSPGYEKINALMKKQRDVFFTKENLNDVWNYEASRHDYSDTPKESDDTYQNIYKLDNVQITDKYITFTIGYEWYMGGVFDYGLIPYVFDLNGDPIELTKLYNKSDKDIKDMVINAVKNYVRNEAGDLNSLMEWDALNKIDKFKFFMKDGIPYLVFVKYEIAAGAAGGFIIPLPKP